MKRYSGFKYFTVGIGAAVLLLAFNNCGEGFVAERMGSSFGGMALFSRAPGQTCEDALLSVYRSSFHPFLNQTCNGCHISGPGIGSFASADAKTSYDAFSSAGAAKISSQAINEAHKPPFTGAVNAGRVKELNSTWASAQTSYVSCLAQSGASPGGSYVVRAAGKPVPAGLGVTNFVRMEWDLETTSSSKVPLIAGIDIRLGAVGGITRGYEYRNPTLRLKSMAAGSYQARALNIYVNNEMQTEVTTYTTVDATISALTDLNLSLGSANAFNTRAVAATDLIGLEFQSLGLSTSVANPVILPAPVVGTTSTPVPAPASGATPIVSVMTFAQLNAAGGLFRNQCIGCHEVGNARGGLDLTNYAAAKAAAQNIRFRVNNAANPMPTGGLLLSEQRDVINAWVDAGAPQ